MKIKKIFFTALVLLTCLAAVELGKRLAGPKGVFRAEIRDASRAKGDPKAKLWISEYLDFQCQDCARAQEIIKEYLKNYPAEIYYQARFLPLASHVHGWPAALAAECAARQKAYWEYEALLFEHQAVWSEAEDAKLFFEEYAALAGLDVAKWARCLESPEASAALTAEKEKARSLGIDSTPTFFVNDKQIIGSAGLKEELKGYFEAKNEK